MADIWKYWKLWSSSHGHEEFDYRMEAIYNGSDQDYDLINKTWQVGSGEVSTGRETTGGVFVCVQMLMCFYVLVCFVCPSTCQRLQLKICLYG